MTCTISVCEVDHHGLNLLTVNSYDCVANRMGYGFDCDDPRNMAMEDVEI